MELKQYQIIWINLDPTIGSEVKKIRPCLIISPNEMNEFLNTIIIAPITSTSKEYPTRIFVSTSTIKGWVMIDQIRTVDKERIVKIENSIDFLTINKIKEVLKETFVD